MTVYIIRKLVIYTDTYITLYVYKKKVDFFNMKKYVEHKTVKKNNNFSQNRYMNKYIVYAKHAIPETNITKNRYMSKIN